MQKLPIPPPVQTVKKEPSGGFGIFSQIYKTIWKGDSKDDGTEQQMREAEKAATRPLYPTNHPPVPSSATKQEP